MRKVIIILTMFFFSIAGIIILIMFFSSIAQNATTFMSSEMRIKPYNFKTEKYEVPDTSKISVPIVVEDL